jgi:phosphoribosyl-AMP cyclohydrolase
MNTSQNLPIWTPKLNFEKLDGLLPAIIVDHVSKDVLMLGFMNQETFGLTIKTGYVHYWSRTRQKIWKKGETSGNTQKVISLTPDCDYDTLLIFVEQIGPTCHTGERTCFFADSWQSPE